MEKNEKRVSILVEDDDQSKASNLLEERKSNMKKLKKPLIFGLMAIVCLGCMYLIFKPSSNKKETENIGLNDAVPQATEAGMQSDKQKAYEQEMLEQKDQADRNAMATLSDYWNSDDKKETTYPQTKENESFGNSTGSGYGRSGTSPLNSYRNAQSTLGSFYQNDNSETMELRRKVDELKEKLSEKSIPPATTVNDQLALMEKSYQMAAKYLPNGNNTTNSTEGNDSVKTRKAAPPKENFAAFTPVRKNVVSALYREPSDSEFLQNLNSERNRGFYTEGTVGQQSQSKNSTRACVQETQTILEDGAVKLRLLEAAKMPNISIPAGTIVTANAKFNNGRLSLKVSSIEVDGNITPVEINIYDLDGQQGLYVPFSPERNAVTDIVANMGNATGSSFSMTSSTGQQIASDLSRSAVQGISGYFSKKVRTPKVTLKAGYQVFLVSKK